MAQPAGKPVTRSEAIEIARRTIEQAERERGKLNQEHDLMEIRVREAVGGYIFTHDNGVEEVFTDLRQVFLEILFQFDEKWPGSEGDEYGDVIVKSEKNVEK